MCDLDIENVLTIYEKNGLFSPVRLISEQDAIHHEGLLEEAETSFGNMHYRSEIHTIHTSPLMLAILPSVLDIVEQVIGPNILLYNVTYIIKEPKSQAHVSWHQDLTYWGLSHDGQISMWLALSRATLESGCMRMIPGSHLGGRMEHVTTDDSDNVLLQGQTVSGVNESDAHACPLAPGEATFHHGWTLNDSTPNQSADRRIGLNVQYLATHVWQTKHDLDTAMLVRGQDEYGHFESDRPAISDLDPAAMARQACLEDRYVRIAGKQ